MSLLATATPGPRSACRAPVFPTHHDDDAPATTLPAARDVDAARHRLGGRAGSRVVVWLAMNTLAALFGGGGARIE